VGASYWLEGHERPLPRNRLAGDPDVAVVGGGVTGCACARALAQGGLRVRLYEARDIASGASGRNGGFALRGGAMPYDRARRTLGAARAKALWRLSEEALDRLGELAGDALRRTGSLRLAADVEEQADLRAEAAALAADGFEVEVLDELDEPLRGLFHGGLVHPRDGSLHPVRWVGGLALLAVEAGVELCEHRRVETLAELRAEHVVIATDGYTRGLVPELDAAVRPTRGQVLVTEPLPRRLFERPHYARRGFDYWQQLPDGRLVIGGQRDASFDAEWTAEESTTSLVQDRIEGLVRLLVGTVPRITHRWAGIFGSTADLLPLAGLLPGRPGVWAACGYSGHGNVLGLACGELVAGAILGRPDPLLELFDPGRLSDD